MIDKLLDALHSYMTVKDSGMKTDLAVFRRLHALSIISYMRNINMVLGDRLKTLDTDVDFFALNIDYDKYLNRAYWEESWLIHDYCELNNVAKEIVIDKMSDYMPHVVEGRQFSKENVTPIRSGMRLICDSESLNDIGIKYALQMGLDELLIKLSAMKKKTKNPSARLMRKFWHELVAGVDSEAILKEYKYWKKEVGQLTFQLLEDKQAQILAKVLTTDFLRFRPKPTRGETSSCKFAINEDSLELGSQLPGNIKEQCARLNSFIIWKDRDNDYVSFDYERLGKYIYKHYKGIGAEINTLIECDIILDAIHEDMAALKPELKKYLKNNANNQPQQLLKDCTDILNCCQAYLKYNIRTTIITDFLTQLLSDPEMEVEVQEKLAGKSRNKYLCQIIATLYYFHVFKSEVGIEELARSLSQHFDKPNLKSVKHYIIVFQHERNDTLYTWAKENIEKLKHD